MTRTAQPHHAQPQPDQTQPFQPLSGLRGVSIAVNVPGPVAAHLLARDGLDVVKVEPPAGDPLLPVAGEMYAELADGMAVQRLDLRSPEGAAALATLLEGADLLITSHRPSALARLGLTAERLAQRHPHLCWVEIVGDEDAPEVPGHDLTYQLQAGLLQPPQMPSTLIADLSGAMLAAQAATALLLGRERGRPERWRRVGLKQAAHLMAWPRRGGLTAPTGLLSGAEPQYRVYALQDGWAAVAALEPHFHARYGQALAGQSPESYFARLTVQDCERLAHDRDLPIHAVAGG